MPRRVVYSINRMVYNEEEFEREHDQKLYSQLSKDSQSPHTGRKIQCRFSCARFKKLMLKMFPVLNWLFTYSITEWILGDIHAGINVGMVQIFQGLSAIVLTGLPVPIINSFYSAFCCSLTYVLFGTSRHMSIGSFSILNAMSANFQNNLAFNIKYPANVSLASFSDVDFMRSYMEALSYLASTTFLVGSIQLLLGILGLGFVTTYISESLMNAYLTAAALHVIISQFSFIFGIVIDVHSGPLSIFYNLVYYCIGLPKANSTSILLFLLALLMLRVSKCIKITYKHYPVEFPMELVLIIIFTVLANHTKLYAESSKGMFKSDRFLDPTLPDFSKLDKIVLHSLAMAIVSYFLLIFVGKKYARVHNYHIRHTQDLMAIGLCNVFSSFFKSFPVTCAISTTVIQEKTGGKTQLASLIGVSLMLVLGLKLGYYFQALPNSVLAAIVLVNMFPFLEKCMDVPYLWKQDKYDFGIWIVTFIAVLCLGLDIGLGISLGFAFFIISVRAHRMKMMTLGQIPNTNIYRSFSDYNEAIEVQGVKIFQCCASISFANMKYFKAYILKKMDLKAVPLDENELRALISVSMSSVKGKSKDLKCACVCDPPESLPRIPFREKLITRVHTANESFSSSSVALVRWTRNRYSSDAQHIQIPAREKPYEYAKRNNGHNKSWFRPHSLLTKSTTQLYSLDSECTMSMIHTIVLDFSMVHFVDLQASCLLQELCHIFQNIGITILIAACHPTVIKTFEKHDFFDHCVTKARFFPSLHDAILFAIQPKILEESAQVDNVTADEILADIHLEEEKDRRSQLSGRSKQSDRRSQQSDRYRESLSPKTVRSETYLDEPISDLFRTFSLQSDLEVAPHHHIDESPLEDNEDDQDWEGKWNYPRES